MLSGAFEKYTCAYFSLVGTSFTHFKANTVAIVMPHLDCGKEKGLKRCYLSDKQGLKMGIEKKGLWHHVWGFDPACWPMHSLGAALR